MSWWLQHEPALQSRGMAAPRRRCPSLASMEMDAESTGACVLQEPRTPEIGRGELRVRLRTALCRCVSRSLWSAKVFRSPVASLAPNPVLLGCIRSGDVGGATDAATMPVRMANRPLGLGLIAAALLGGRGRCHRSARRGGRGRAAGPRGL